MITEIERAWLAGIIDGEGCISLFHTQEKNGSHKIRPVINFVNTDVGIVNSALDILDRAECSVYIVKRNQSKKNNNHKDVIEVKTTNMTNIKIWLDLIEPYLRGEKKHKAQILLRYVSRRIEKFPDRTYTQDDWNDLNNIRSSQTTRETPRFDSQVW